MLTCILGALFVGALILCWFLSGEVARLVAEKRSLGRRLDELRRGEWYEANDRPKKYVRYDDY